MELSDLKNLPPNKHKNFKKTSGLKLGLSSILRFGQHSGKTISKVLEEDPRYLVWALSKKIIQLSRKAYNDLRLRLIELDNEYSRPIPSYSSYKRRGPEDPRVAELMEGFMQSEPEEYDLWV